VSAGPGGRVGAGPEGRRAGGPAGLVRHALRLVARPARTGWRRLRYFPGDALARLAGRSDLLPPRGRISVVAPDTFREAGRSYCEQLVRLGGLRPDDRVLEVGCGIGRVASPLTAYLAGGSYEGVDVAADAVRWCRRHITPRHPAFRFQWADVYNGAYNPGGRLAATAYRFPYPDASFDFALLTSVFTHLLPRDLAHYLRRAPPRRAPRRPELRHVLSPRRGGARPRPRGTEPARLPCHDLGGAWTTHPGTPETAVAYDETTVRALYRRHGRSSSRSTGAPGAGAPTRRWGRMSSSRPGSERLRRPRRSAG
jgi:SAM-dependent methyltransferase